MARPASGDPARWVTKYLEEDARENPRPGVLDEAVRSLQRLGKAAAPAVVKAARQAPERAAAIARLAARLDNQAVVRAMQEAASHSPAVGAVLHLMGLQDDAAAAAQILESGVLPGHFSATTALELVRSIGARSQSRDDDLLQALGQFPDERVRSAARRMLEYRTGTVRPQAAMAFYGEPFKAWLNVTEGDGEHEIVYARERTRGGIGVVFAMLRDDVLQGCDVVSMSKRELGGMLEQVTVAECPPEYAGYRIYTASERAFQLGKPQPASFAEAREVLGDRPRDIPDHPILRLVSTPELMSDLDLLAHGEELFDTPELEHWFLRHSSVVRAGERVLGLPQWGQLSGAPRHTLILQEARQLLSEAFDTRLKVTYQRRLEDMAYIFIKTGRPRPARLAMAVALRLRRLALTPLESVPFIVTLAVRGIYTILVRSMDERPHLPEWVAETLDEEQAARSSQPLLYLP